MLAAWSALSVCAPPSPLLGAEPSHAIAMHGSPALVPGFLHFRYVDPAAPKGGRLVASIVGTFDSVAMSRGEPGLPGAFTWRDQPYTVARVMSKWKSTGTDRGEVYLRRHWFRIETTTGEHMTLYCQRQTKNPKKPKARWWVYSVTR